MEQNKSILTIFSVYKALTILAYIYITLKYFPYGHIIALLVSVVLVLVKVWFLDKPFLKKRSEITKITKASLMFLVIADINLIMIIPAIFDLIKDVIVAGLVQDHSAKSHYGTYDIVAAHSIGMFSSCVLVLYIIEQQFMKYINFETFN